MRVAVLSYPTLFQTAGGLKMKVERTVNALVRRGIDARLIDPVTERIRDFDVVHVFAAFNGNHRIVEQAKSDGLPVVLSTILSPRFNKRDGQIARFLTRFVGRMTGWEVTTSYGQIASSISMADHLVVLGRIERSILADGYLASPEKISIVPNGIGAEFFNTSPELFLARYPEIPRPFVLHTGHLYDVKNQLGLIRAMAGTGVNIVLVGYAGRGGGAAYLADCLREGGENVRHLGELEHGEMIASANAAAAVVAVPSRYEGMPNSVLEALATDRPVVLTENHTMDLHLPPDVAAEVAPDDHAAIRRAVTGFLEHPPLPGRARAVVAEMSWDKVAEQLEAIYRNVCSPGNAASPLAAAS
jgi:glycosyltransferase involved in cell wall biosynthesis